MSWLRKRAWSPYLVLYSSAIVTAAITLLAIPASDSLAQAQRGKGRNIHSGRHDAAFAKDRELFHLLLNNRDKIERDVQRLDNGVETRTESGDPKIAKAIQEHVESMYRRVTEQRPIHRRDPLFDAIFRHVGDMEMQFEKTPQGVRVVETSADPYVARLIQAHADVVSLFIRNGHGEVRQNHPVPKRTKAGSP